MLWIERSHVFKTDPPAPLVPMNPPIESHTYELHKSTKDDIKTRIAVYDDDIHLIEQSLISLACPFIKEYKHY
jgi:hypothetical protein